MACFGGIWFWESMIVGFCIKKLHNISQLSKVVPIDCKYLWEAAPIDFLEHLRVFFPSIYDKLPQDLPENTISVKRKQTKTNSEKPIKNLQKEVSKSLSFLNPLNNPWKLW